MREDQRLTCERDWLVERLAEAQATIRASNGVSHVPTDVLARLIRENLAQIDWGRTYPRKTV